MSNFQISLQQASAQRRGGNIFNTVFFKFKNLQQLVGPKACVKAPVEGEEKDNGLHKVVLTPLQS